MTTTENLIHALNKAMPVIRSMRDDLNVANWYLQNLFKVFDSFKQEQQSLTACKSNPPAILVNDVIGKPMKIYVASSWRNSYQQKVVSKLRELGHEVYDFKNPQGAAENSGFHWSEIDPNWEAWTPEQYVNYLNHPIAERGFKSDFDAMKWADCCIMVLPCGRSANTEAGWMKGVGKKVYVFMPIAQEPELMYKVYDGVFTDYKQLESLTAYEQEQSQSDKPERGEETKEQIFIKHLKHFECGCNGEEKKAIEDMMQLYVDQQTAPLIAEINRLKAENEWIPVSERLPKVSEYVLIYSTQTGIREDRLTGIRMDGTPEFYGNREEYDLGVTHWRPLPTPHEK